MVEEEQNKLKDTERKRILNNFLDRLLTYQEKPEAEKDKSTNKVIKKEKTDNINENEKKNNLNKTNIYPTLINNSNIKNIPVPNMLQNNEEKEKDPLDNEIKEIKKIIENKKKRSYDKIKQENLKKIEKLKEEINYIQTNEKNQLSLIDDELNKEESDAVFTLKNEYDKIKINDVVQSLKKKKEKEI